MSKSERMVNSSQERFLDEFLIGNTELEELSAKLKEFNIFQILRIEQAEIRHSNVLSWLLNPRESHGLNDVFVKRFISTLLLDNEQANFDLSPAKVELKSFVDVEVRREWHNIDLLIYSKKNKLVVLIENKIRARESKGNLIKYKEIVKKEKEFRDFDLIPVFLTLEGDEPSDEAKDLDYIPWSHAALYRVVTEVVVQHQNHIPQDVQTFLRHYLTILGRETMEDDKLQELCKEIYRKHKTAIDLIVRYGATTTFGEAVKGFLDGHSTELKEVGNTTHYFGFIPKEWSERMPNEVKGWVSTYPISFLLVQISREPKVGIILEIGPWTDVDQRSKLVKAFNEAGFVTSAKSRQPGSRYTRVYSHYQIVQDFGDLDEVRHTIDDLWQQSKDKLEKATEIVDKFNWNRTKSK